MFAYVVLHYRTLELTKDCVSHLRTLSPDSHIVIVDNGSADGSGSVLHDLYSGCDMVDVISSPENLGFASGNNLGFQYARSRFSPDYIVVMNNDVIITQPDFEERIASHMAASNVDVCGPDIHTPDGHHQNPLRLKPFGTFRIVKQMMIDAARLACLRLGIFQDRILGTYTQVSNDYHQQTVEVVDVCDCIVHGACVVFGPRYISDNDFAFLPVTFLYGEEMILFDFCGRRGYRSGVCASAQVLHLGGKSTMVDVSQRARQIFKIRNTLESMCQLVRLRLFPGKY